MKISEYIKHYTKGDRITLWRSMDEARELVVEIFKFNKKGIKEEFQDLMHFLQLWLYWRFGIDGEIWENSKDSVKKFMDRKEVWKRIYVFVGLDENISNYVGNPNKEWKVVEHLNYLGIPKEKAKECYNKIILRNSL